MCQHSRELLCHVLCKDILKHAGGKGGCLHGGRTGIAFTGVSVFGTVGCWLFGQSLGHSIIRQLFSFWWGRLVQLNQSFLLCHWRLGWCRQANIGLSSMSPVALAPPTFQLRASRASWSRNCASFESSGAFPLALGSAALGSAALGPAAGSASWMVLTQPCFGWKIQYSPFHHTGLSIPSLPVLGCTPFRKLADHAACLRPLDRL